jgi:tRNA(fMet)-specific endonuclease VapC
MDSRRIVVDTSVYIKHIRATKKEKTLLYNIPNNIILVTTAITVYELLMGAKATDKVHEFNRLTQDVEVLSFDEQAARKAAEIYHELRLKNQMIEFRDIFIAAICIVNNLELITLNEKHFERIEGLKIYST